MPEIRRREQSRGIRVLDRGAVLEERLKRTAARVKEAVEDLTEEQDSPEAYAEGRIRHVAEVPARDAGRVVKEDTGRIAQRGRELLWRKRKEARAKNEAVRTVRRNERTMKKAAVSMRRTAARTTRKAVKTAEVSAKAVKKAAEASAKTAQKASAAAKQTAAVAYRTAAAAGKAVVSAIRAIIAAMQKLAAAIAAGGWVSVVIIVIICLIGLIAGSAYGIFLSGEDTGNGMTLRQAVQEINGEYQERIESIKANNPHDEVILTEARAAWPEVLSVYAVKVTGGGDAGEVASMDEEKKQLLAEIFWEMNTVSHRTETVMVTVSTELTDGEGNILTEEHDEPYIMLYISASHRDAEQMAELYGFSGTQKKLLDELLAEDSSLWMAVLYGVYGSDDMIVQVALSQLGNIGGEPYWSWYRFDSRVAWCACFVSWCADQCGYIESGVMPKYAGCETGVRWFKERGQWADNSIVPSPGMIIFFDWDDPYGVVGGQDGLAEHTGIVEKVENGFVWTIEGNSNDQCRERYYPVGYYEILGYGIPVY